MIFVVYGSLVPLDFHPLPLDVAWQRLLHAPFLHLGVESRADWVANGVLYFPVGFLTAGLLRGGASPGPLRRALAWVGALAFGAALAVAVEWAQTAFPPRTVSLNDLLAEVVGTAIGVVAAPLGAVGLRRVLEGFAPGGGVLAWRLGLLYAFAFPAIAMFPFDFLISAGEWRAKLDSNLVGAWLAPSSIEMGVVRLVAKLAVEMVVVAPLGVLWAYRRAARRHLPAGIAAAAARGALLGLAIELGQLTIASGQSQGVSVATRSLGFTLGAAAWTACAGLHRETLRAALRRWSWLLLTTNVALLGVLAGVWRGPWLSLGVALHRLDAEVRFVPFYYHYYTTEMQAVVSLVAVSLSYAPLGALGWAWGASRSGVAVMAALLAAVMEAAKLFAEGAHPDPGNVFIGGTAAWAAQTVLDRLMAPADRRR